jgi:hypothetical protein
MKNCGPSGFPGAQPGSWLPDTRESGLTELGLCTSRFRLFFRFSSSAGGFRRSISADSTILHLRTSEARLRMRRRRGRLRAAAAPAMRPAAGGSLIGAGGGRLLRAGWERMKMGACDRVGAGLRRGRSVPRCSVSPGFAVSAACSYAWGDHAHGTRRPGPEAATAYASQARPRDIAARKCAPPPSHPALLPPAHKCTAVCIHSMRFRLRARARPSAVPASMPASLRAPRKVSSSR